MSANKIADRLYEHCLDRYDKAKAMEGVAALDEAAAAWKEYKAGLEKKDIILTLSGYQFDCKKAKNMPVAQHEYDADRKDWVCRTCDLVTDFCECAEVDHTPLFLNKPAATWSSYEWDWYNVCFGAFSDNVVLYWDMVYWHGHKLTGRAIT